MYGACVGLVYMGMRGACVNARCVHTVLDAYMVARGGVVMG